MTQETDELIKLWLGGDRKVADLLLTNLFPLLKARIIKVHRKFPMLSNETSPTSLLDTSLRELRKINGARLAEDSTTENLVRYVVGIAKNKARNKQRGMLRREKTVRSAAGGQNKQVDILDPRELDPWIDEFLDSIPDEIDRMIVTLKMNDDTDTRIANKLQLRLPDVKARLRKLRAELREFLDA